MWVDINKKIIIENILTQNAHDYNSSLAGRLLFLIQEETFPNDTTFIYEFVQNAQDAAEKPNRSMIFEIVDDYILISNDSKPFAENDVANLCTAAYRGEGTKSQAQDKIGHKDIGFKSIFKVSDRVQIISNGFSFRFEKPAVTTHLRVKPWQVIPIWTNREDTPTFLRDKLSDKNKTYFLIKLKPEINLTEKLEFLKNKHEFLLFLPHLDRIECILSDNHSFSITKTQNANKTYLKLKERGKPEVVSNWMIKNYDLPIPESSRKLPQETHASIYLAAPLENDQIQVRPTSTLFCFFPTTTEVNLPVLISANFQLNLQRTELMPERPFNQYIIRSFPFLLLDWIAKLTENSLLYPSLLQLLPPPYIQVIAPELKSAYENGFKIAINNVAFVPTFINKEKLLKISEVKFDPYGFINQFSEECYQAFNDDKSSILSDIQLPYYPDPRLEIGLKRLGELIPFDRKLTFPSIKSVVEKMLVTGIFPIAHPERYQALLIFLFTTFKNEGINKAKIIAINNNMDYLSMADKNLFFLPEQMDDQPLPIANLKFIHPLVFQGNLLIKNILIENGKKNLNDENYLLEVCNEIYHKGHGIVLEEKTANTLYNYLYRHQEKLKQLSITNPEINHRLSFLPIETQAGTFQRAFTLYSSQLFPAYSPILPFSSLVRATSGQEAFHQLLSVRNSISITAFQQIDVQLVPSIFLTSLKIQDEFINFDNLGEKYLNWLRAKYTETEKTNYTLLEGFFTVNLIETLYALYSADLLDKPLGKQLYLAYMPMLFETLKTYIRQLHAQESSINQRSAYFVNPTQLYSKKPCPYHFIQYIFCKYPFIQSDDERFYKSSEIIYIPTLQDIIGQFYLTIHPQFSALINLQLADWLGFITKLDENLCFDMLSKIDIIKNMENNVRLLFYKTTISKLLAQISLDMPTEPTYHPQTGKKVYARAMENYRIDAKAHKERLLGLKSAIAAAYLPAQDGSLQLASTLYYCADELFYLDRTHLSNKFLKCYDFWSKEDYLKICRLFQLSPLTLQDVEIEVDSPVNCIVKTYIQNRLVNYVAQTEANETDKNIKDIRNKYINILNDLTFIQGETLWLRHKCKKERIQTTLAFFNKTKNNFYLTDINLLTLDVICYWLVQIFSLNPDSTAAKHLKIAIGTKNDNELAQYFPKQGMSVVSIEDDEDRFDLESESLSDAEQAAEDDTKNHSMIASSTTNATHLSNSSQKKPSLRASLKPTLSMFANSDFSSMPSNSLHRYRSIQAPVAVEKKLKMDVTETGRRAEEDYFSYLQEHYMTNPKKYTITEKTETLNGFKIKGIKKYMNKKNTNFSIEVTWHNKINEMGGPRDFTVYKIHNGIVKNLCIEVKATVEKGPSRLMLSTKELEEKEKAGNNYRLIRYYAMASETTFFKKFKSHELPQPSAHVYKM